MSTRISSLGALLALAACGGAGQPQAAEGAQRFECAVGQGAAFAADCLVEREVREGETLVIVRWPDGGFRRFVELSDGRGLATADGADEAVAKLSGGMLEIRVADERYRFPTRTMKADDRAE